VWVALEDANEVNGCLEVICKGHLLPELDRERLALEEFASCLLIHN
jgi:ectoine hydroxylase-related dioxygenase (phytanoyl-CoA dioxygenase family)